MKITIDDPANKDLEIKALKKQNAKLQSDMESMHGHVESARKANRKKYVPKASKKRRKADWVRMILPDLHGSRMSKPAFAAVCADLKRVEVDEVVMLGDMMECGGFLAAHHTMGYVAETEYTYEEDIAATNQAFDTLLSLAPKCTNWHYLEGNHERRVEKWAVTQALRNKKDSQFLLDQVGPENVLGLKERGIKYYRQAERYDGMTIPGTIKLNKSYYTHGISTAKHAASVHAARFGGNIYFGHTHRNDSWVSHTVDAGDIGAWCPGCLCEKQPMWLHTNPSAWTQGYGLQVEARSQNFLPIQVGIIDGESMFMDMRSKLWIKK